MQIRYGHKKENGLYDDIFFHPLQVRMTEDIRYPKSVYKLAVREALEGEYSAYWGWKDNKGVYSLVFDNPMALDVCFPYGIKAAEEHGQGIRVRLIIEEIE